MYKIFNADYDIVTGAKKSEETPGVCECVYANAVGS